MSALPSQVPGVTLTLKANLYFDGRVISHTIVDSKGVRKTVGVILPGSYVFKTDAPERMDIIAGECRAKVGGAAEWAHYKTGEYFQVPGHSSFEIAVDKGLAEYLCTFE